MKHINIILLALVAFCVVSCKYDQNLYGDGPDIAYFDKGGILSEEIAEKNLLLKFRVVSPLAASYDRDYTVSTTFGSTLVEGTHFSIPKKVITIKANENWVDGEIEFVPGTLKATVDTLALKITTTTGKIASFDNVLKVLVTKRCPIDIDKLVGKYTTTSGFPGTEGMLIKNTVEVAKTQAGQLLPNTLRVLSMYNNLGGDNIDILLREDEQTGRIIPEVRLQYARQIEVQGGVTYDGFVCSPDQHEYPKLPKSENYSSSKTCLGEFSLALTWGVIKNNEDGTTLEGHLEGTPAVDVLKRDDVPDFGSSTSPLGARNVDYRCMVTAE